MDVFYAPEKRADRGTITIDGEEHHHLAHVLRKRVGEEVLVTDGEGTMHQVRIDHIDREQCRLSILRTHREYHEPRRAVMLVQAMLRNPHRMDWLIEKATELGVRYIHPVMTERSIPKSGRVERWRHIALAATKQSLRSRVPLIETPMGLADALDGPHSGLVICLHESAEDKLADVIISMKDAQQVVVCVGPEGGFSDAELQLMSRFEARILSLGERRLRSETAALAALTLLLS